MSRLLLATGAGCGNCGPAKLALAAADIEFDILDVYGDDAEAQMPEGLRGIPALIQSNEILAVGLGPITQWIDKSKK